MTRVPFALLLAVGLAVAGARATPADRPIGAPGAVAREPAVAVTSAPLERPRCPVPEMSVTNDPYTLLVRIAAAALQVIARVFQLPGWVGAHDAPSGRDDLTAAIDTLWSYLTEASRAVATTRGNGP